MTFETRFLRGKLASKLTFAYAVINEIHFSSLTHGIVCINSCLAYITLILRTKC